MSLQVVRFDSSCKGIKKLRVLRAEVQGPLKDRVRGWDFLKEAAFVGIPGTEGNKANMGFFGGF